jgi:hypothetical protein
MAQTQLRGTQIADNSLTADDVVYSLNDAYDNGGSGLGRVVTVDAGPVILDGSASTAMIISGTLELYGPTATGPAIKIVRGDLELNNSIKIEAGNGQNLQIYHDGANAAINNNTGHLLINAPSTMRMELAISGSTSASQLRIKRTVGAAADTLLQVQGDGNIIFGSGSLGNSTFTHNVIAQRVQGKHMAATTQVIADAATINWNMDNGSVMQVTLAGNRTMAAPTNLVSGGTYTAIIKQDATGNRLLTWNAVFKFAGGSKTLSTAANATDVATFVSDGVNLYGQLLKALA